MGSPFLYLLREQPPENPLFSELEALCFHRRYAGLLGSAMRRMPKEVRTRFPLLAKVDTRHGAYVGEELLLSPEDVRTLRDELHHLRAVINFEAFEPRLDGPTLLKYWKGEETTEANFKKELHAVNALLNLAVDKHAWIHISL